mmetsp:Transcript_81720/g.210418  ORF Transcript_81720/g.210418 Transcript_81720/m.210418 type:complete len:521 (-) Transcript_81720:970-2532(-)
MWTMPPGCVRCGLSTQSRLWRFTMPAPRLSSSPRTRQRCQGLSESHASRKTSPPPAATASGDVSRQKPCRFLSMCMPSSYSHCWPQSSRSHGEVRSPLWALPGDGASRQRPSGLRSWPRELWAQASSEQAASATTEALLASTQRPPALWPSKRSCVAVTRPQWWQQVPAHFSVPKTSGRPRQWLQSPAAPHLEFVHHALHRVSGSSPHFTVHVSATCAHSCARGSSIVVVVVVPQRVQQVPAHCSQPKPSCVLSVHRAQLPLAPQLPSVHHVAQRPAASAPQSSSHVSSVLQQTSVDVVEMVDEIVRVVVCVVVSVVVLVAGVVVVSVVVWLVEVVVDSQLDVVAVVIMSVLVADVVDMEEAVGAEEVLLCLVAPVPQYWQHVPAQLCRGKLSDAFQHLPHDRLAPQPSKLAHQARQRCAASTPQSPCQVSSTCAQGALSPSSSLSPAGASNGASEVLLSASGSTEGLSAGEVLLGAGLSDGASETALVGDAASVDGGAAVGAGVGVELGPSLATSTCRS